MLKPWFFTEQEISGWIRYHHGTTRFIPMNYFEAVGVFYAFMDSKPCWQPLSEVWPES